MVVVTVAWGSRGGSSADGGPGAGSGIFPAASNAAATTHPPSSSSTVCFPRRGPRGPRWRAGDRGALLLQRVSHARDRSRNGSTFSRTAASLAGDSAAALVFLVGVTALFSSASVGVADAAI